MRIEMYVILLILFPKCLRCQSVIQPHGTLIVAFICNNGIILAADSRASFTAYNDIVKREIPYAYVDSFRKIFTLGGFQIGITGNENVGNIYWWDLVEKYNKTHKRDSSLKLTFLHFSKYLINDLKISDSLLRGNFFIVAGFEGNRPVITGINSIHSDTIFSVYNVGHRIATNDCIKSKLAVNENYCTCDSIINLLVNGFTSCSQDWQLGIGGPLHIVRINQGNHIVTIKSFKFIRFRTYTDFEKSIINKTTIVTHFFPEYTRDKLIEILKDNVLHHY